MFKNFSRPVIFGHRGACAFAPENTIASFALAAEQNADAVELDAKLSKDGVVVVIHDQTVDRTTDGLGKVNTLNLTDLKKLDAGSKFKARYSGEKIPTLAEVFESVGSKLFINVELTNYGSPEDALVEKVAELVLAHKMQSRVLFSSFLPKNLVLARRLLPEVPVALLCLPGLGGVFSRSFLYHKTSPAIVHPYLSDVHANFVKKQHEKGRRVHVWTVNAEADLKRMYAAGVDGIFTDDPGKAFSLLPAN